MIARASFPPAARSRFAAIVGAQWVFTAEDDMAAYGDAFAPGAWEDNAPSGAVAPGSVEEVQALLRAAGELGVALWTVSTGRNLAYGGSAPVVPGSVVLDLRRLDAVITVDEDLGYAVVEPGVTFFALHRYLEERHSRLWISSPAPGWGSVVGNALERGFGPTAYGDHAQQVCGMEVVLADGSVLRTGMGALPNGETWGLFKSGYGPGWDQAFMQSNYGVVTKLCIWLMPRPEAMAVARVEFAREEDLALAVDALRPLRIEGVINGIANLRNAVGAAVATSRRSDWYEGKGPIPEDVVQTIMRKLDVGWWSLQFAIYGRDGVVQPQLAIARAALEAIPGARFEASVKAHADLAAPDRGGGGSRAGIPGLGGLGIVDWRGGAGGHIDFSPVFAPRGATALALHRQCRAIIEEGGQDYMGTAYNFGRSMALICAIVFNRDDADETARVRSVFSRLIREVGAAGFGEYRTHVRYMDEVAQLYSRNGGALGRFNQRIKDALDPAGVLSPGKQGIWPRRYRNDTTGENG